MNTDEEKQGYEYAVYVFENSIYLLNYDKDSNAKRIELAELYSSQEVCGLIPHKTASEKSFADKGKSNRSTLDLPIITIEYKQENQVCDPELNTRDTLNFSTAIKENEDNLLDIFKTTGKSEDILGGHIIDYSSDNNRRGRIHRRAFRSEDFDPFGKKTDAGSGQNDGHQELRGSV